MLPGLGLPGCWSCPVSYSARLLEAFLDAPDTLCFYLQDSREAMDLHLSTTTRDSLSFPDCSGLRGGNVLFGDGGLPIFWIAYRILHLTPLRQRLSHSQKARRKLPAMLGFTVTETLLSRHIMRSHPTQSP